ncbi:hypothetical protein EYF80_019175 [Liparis tanakae]|uniref:Uncharacterized protein n=1 Tax=Liparis tanakae TaxID=230148 RepID=A0A4Z2HYE3_9TELE|nr:hypothetical protein EYF80_019175 [Liparis tanakae]
MALTSHRLGSEEGERPPRSVYVAGYRGNFVTVAGVVDIRGSQHDPKSPEEHEDAVGLCQFVQADDFSGDVGGERPVSREETQGDRQNLQSQIRFSAWDKKQRHTSSKHGEGVQIDAVNPLDVHQHTQHQFTHTSGNGPDRHQRNDTNFFNESFTLRHVLYKEHRGERPEAEQEDGDTEGHHDLVLQDLVIRRRLLEKLLLCAVLQSGLLFEVVPRHVEGPHEAGAGHEVQCYRSDDQQAAIQAEHHDQLVLSGGVDERSHTCAWEKMRNWTFGAKALSIRPPATMTPLKIVTGRAPKLSTQALQTGPEGEEYRCKKRKHKSIPATLFKVAISLPFLSIREKRDSKEKSLTPAATARSWAMKEAATITHPHPPSSTPVDGAMVMMLLLPSGIRDSFDRDGAPGNDKT